ncbi:hypothetical protein CVT25_012050 [Psilocybe cyanescens]|uniref:Uncharacterized protein n=1 Tax=Psilocybe cyanescens TaxID=93625 RepID=A0A409X7N4_PSICY|nr:hypothetical protein CVT25_012050 [Psilocybe cyanescens]
MSNVEALCPCFKDTARAWSSKGSSRDRGYEFGKGISQRSTVEEVMARKDAQLTRVVDEVEGR